MLGVYYEAYGYYILIIHLDNFRCQQLNTHNYIDSSRLFHTCKIDNVLPGISSI